MEPPPSALPPSSLSFCAQQRVNMTDHPADLPTSTLMLVAIVANNQLKTASPRLERSLAPNHQPSLPVREQRKVSTSSIITDHRYDPPTSTPTLVPIVAGNQLETTSPRLECSLVLPSPWFQLAVTMAHDGWPPIMSFPTHHLPEPLSTPSLVA
jgi:hypothetical protein